jgi:hypothetical protein
MVPEFEMLAYDESLDLLIKEADVALFPRVGSANRADYEKLLKAGVPVVVRNSCDQGLIKHMKNGWIFQDEAWALQWINHLRSNPSEIERIRKLAGEVEQAVVPSVEVEKQPKDDTCDVTVITPTFRRDPKILSRCVSCLMLQTNSKWEQLICSNGGEEKHVKGFVESLGDPRVQYHFVTTTKEGDFGNTARSEMLKKARGKYVLFFDDDNVILPKYLAEMVSRLANSPDCQFAVAEIVHFGPLNEKEVGKPPKVLKGDPVKLYHIDPLQVLVRRDDMQKIGWDTEAGYLSDGITLEKLGALKCVRVNEVLGFHM